MQFRVCGRNRLSVDTNTTHVVINNVPSHFPHLLPSKPSKPPGHRMASAGSAKRKQLDFPTPQLSNSGQIFIPSPPDQLLSWSGLDKTHIRVRGVEARTDYISRASPLGVRIGQELVVLFCFVLFVCLFVVVGGSPGGSPGLSFRLRRRLFCHLPGQREWVSGQNRHGVAHFADVGQLPGTINPHARFCHLPGRREGVPGQNRHPNTRRAAVNPHAMCPPPFVTSRGGENEFNKIMSK